MHVLGWLGGWQSTVSFPLSAYKDGLDTGRFQRTMILLPFLSACAWAIGTTGAGGGAVTGAGAVLVGSTGFCADGSGGGGVTV